MESVLITVPCAASASARASADLPLAVGPAISTAFTLSRPDPMSLVATLICNPAEASLDSTVIEAARAVLPSPATGQWLDAGTAADIPFVSEAATQDHFRAISDKLREALRDLPIDVVVQPQADRRKRLLLADMDSPLIGQ